MFEFLIGLVIGAGIMFGILFIVWLKAMLDIWDKW